MNLKKIVVVLAATSICASAHSIRRLRRAQKPLTPAYDPFYLAPEGWEKAKPGTVLAHRAIQPGFTSKNKINLDSAYQLLYRTNGIDENDPIYTATTVLVPANARKDKLVLILAYQDSNSIECAPSYLIQSGAPVLTNPVQVAQEMIWTSVLNDGWIVSIPDHEGPRAAFSSGILEGHASLDGVRATLGFDKLQMDPKSPVVGMGYSGGAIAGGWAASLHSTYASDINIAGWALGGTPSNMTATTFGLNNGLFAGLTTAGIAGIVDTYPEANDYVGSVITHEGNSALQFTREHCMGDILLGLANTNIMNESFFKNSNKFLDDPKIRSLLDKLTLGKNPKLTPDAPVYMYHALHDEVIDFKMANATAQQWCDNEAELFFHVYTGLEMGHVSTELLNSPLVLRFIRDRMDQKPFVQGCQWKSDLNPMWNLDVFEAKIKEVLNSINDFFGANIGKGDALFKEKIKNGHFK